MIKDAYDHPITTDRPETVAAFDTYVANHLSYGPHLRVIFQAADDDPTCALVNAHAAGVHMALESASGFRKAEPYLARALRHAPRATKRERLFVAAVEAWARGDGLSAADTLSAIVEVWPSDISAAKWAQYHYFNLGLHAPMLHVSRLILGPHSATPYAHGMLAFALEQAHDLEGAEAAGRRAVAMERVEPWAHHAVAHALGTLGRVEEGLSWMAGHADTWEGRGTFIREHNFWHLALFHLDRDDPEAALAIYDRRLWGEMPEFCQEQIGAVSTLLRLEMRGADVGERWAPVVEKVAEREWEHVQPFHDLHYVLALGRAGRDGDVRSFLASLEAHASEVPFRIRPVWLEVALPMARGLAGFARGDHHTAYRHMAPAIDRLTEIGGSHAQRDLFTQAWIRTLMETGRHQEALALTASRAEAYPAVAETGRQMREALSRMHGAA